MDNLTPRSPKSDLVYLSIAEAARLLVEGEISPVELTRAHLERINSLDPVLNAFITQTAESALDRAEALHSAHHPDSREDQGEVPSLYGIPLAVKDLYDTRGVRTTAGSRFWLENIPGANAHAVDCLEAAGAVLLGKLNMHEIALGVTNVNPHFGPCRNPWNTDRISGGSSGGSAVALAAGLCMGSLGTDTGGSIRIPASLCGIVGLKPTRGRVSLRGVIPLSRNLDHAGPMARTVQDVLPLFKAIAGYDLLDPYSSPPPTVDYTQRFTQGVKNWRIALADDSFFNSKTDPQVRQLVHQSAAAFEQLGAVVESVEFPGALDAARANGLMTVCDAAAFHQHRLEKEPSLFGDDVLRRLRIGAETPIAEYIQARHTQAALRRQFEAFFEDYDLLLTPTTPITAPPIEGPDAVEQAALLTRFTAPFNLTGLPAISILCGFTSENLPVGLQIVTGPWGEAKILQGALAYEGAAGWYERRPPLEEA